MGWTAPNYSTYYTQANADLEKYYADILQQEGYDVERAKARLIQDYKDGIRINNEDYVRNLAFTQESAGASQRELQSDIVKEDRALLGNMLSRGVSEGGVAQTLQGEQKSKQDLRREAIDRALKKSEQDLQYSKERGDLDTDKTKTRGLEDVASQYTKFALEKQKQREDDARQLADQRYQRDFQASSTKESFDLQERAMNP